MTTTISRIVLSSIVCGVLAITLSTGCILDIPLVTAKKTLSEEFATSDDPTVIVETFNGTIDVSPGKPGEVVVDVTKHASGVDQSTAETNLDAVEVSMVQEKNEIHVTAKRIESRVNCGAAVVIAVPPTARVTLHSSNGSIVCEGIRGNVDATSSNGKLEIVEGTGPIKLATSNGGIEVDANDAQLDAKTSNGRIEFRGTLAKGDHLLKTSNGKIRLVLPVDSSFKFEGTTSNSRIDCDFPILSEGKSKRTRLNGTVGDNPAVSITAATSNGQIEIRKARATEN